MSTEGTKIDSIGGDAGRCLLKMALLMIAAMLLNMAYSLVDSLWISNLPGETAYAALANATSATLILTSVVMGAANGMSILLSQAVGAGDQKRTESLIVTPLLMAVVFSLLVTAVLELTPSYTLTALHTLVETYDMACRYLAVYVLGYLAVYLYLYFTVVLRSFGDVVLQVAVMLVSTVFNAILDLIWIHLMDFQGAAAVTLLSQGTRLTFMLVYLGKRKLFSLHVAWSDKSDILPLIQRAVPSVIQQSIPTVSATLLTSLVSAYGITAIAAYGITEKLETILFYSAMALSTVLTAITGQCIGVNRRDRAKDYLVCGLKYGCSLLALLSVWMVTFSKQLPGFSVKNPKAAAIVGAYFLIAGAGYVPNTVTNSFLGLSNGLGKPAYSVCLMIFYYLVVRMPLAGLLSQGGYRLNGIWTAMLISHVCVAAVSGVVYAFQMKRQ